MADTAPCSVQPGFTVGIIGLCHSARRPCFLGSKLQLGFLWDTPSWLPAFRLVLTTARIWIGKGAGGACRQPLTPCLQSFQRGTAVLEEPVLALRGWVWSRTTAVPRHRDVAHGAGVHLPHSAGALEPGWRGTSAPSGPAQHLVPTAAGCTWPSSPEPHGSQDFRTRKCTRKAAGDNLWPLGGCALTRPM